MTAFIIHVSPGSPWYIGFKDKNGVSRLLPAKKRLFKYWKTTNCPKDCKNRVVAVSDGFDEELTPEVALEDFNKRYNSVEEYLGWLND